MAYCFLAKVWELKQQKTKAQQQWEACVKFARPETIYEYKWLVDEAQKEVVTKLDTTSVLAVEDSEISALTATPESTPASP